MALLTLDEVAAELRLSRRTVERLIARGRLRAIAVSERRRCIERAELDLYVAGLRHGHGRRLG